MACIKTIQQSCVFTPIWKAAWKGASMVWLNGSSESLSSDCTSPSAGPCTVCSLSVHAAMSIVPCSFEPDSSLPLGVSLQSCDCSLVVLMTRLQGHACSGAPAHHPSGQIQLMAVSHASEPEAQPSTVWLNGYMTSPCSHVGPSVELVLLSLTAQRLVNCGLFGHTVLGCCPCEKGDAHASCGSQTRSHGSSSDDHSYSPNAFKSCCLFYLHWQMARVMLSRPYCACPGFIS